DFESSEIPASAVPNDAVTDLSAIEGKTVKMPVLAGSVLRLPMLIETEQSRVSGMLLERFGDTNIRAVALPYSLETSVGGTVKTGDFIDIYGLDGQLKSAVLIASQVEVIKGAPEGVEKDDRNS